MRYAKHSAIGLVVLWIFLALAPSAPAQSPIMGIEPPSLTFRAPRKLGRFLLSGAFATRLNNSQRSRFTIIGTDLRPGALFRAVAVNTDTNDEVILAERLIGRRGRVRTRSNGAQPLPDGTYDVDLVMIEPGEDDFRAFMFTMLVDTTPPGPALAPSLPSRFDTGLQSIDKLTSLRDFSLTGSAEPGTTVQVAIDGRTRGPRRTPPALVAFNGAYTVDVRNAPRGEHEYSIVQTDLAGNESVPGATIAITVDDRSPPRPRNLRLVADDIRETRKGLVVANTRRPRIVGVGVPGQRFLIEVDGEPLINGVVLSDGSLSGQIPARPNGPPGKRVFGLTDGLHDIIATQSDTAGNISRSSRPLRVVIDPGTGGGGPPMDIVLTDQFDGNRSPAFPWFSGARDPALLSVNENTAAQRLEFNFSEIEGDRATAAFLSKKWSFDLTKGFRFRVDWTFRSALQVFGRQGLVIGVVSDASSTSGEAFEGAVARIARNDSGDIVRFERLNDGVGVPQDSITTSRLVGIGAVFFEYDATADTLRMTINSLGFNDPGAFVIADFRAKLGSSRAAILLGAEMDGFTPAVSASNATINNLVIEEGLLAQDFVPVSSGANLIPVRSDDFNDGALSSDWTTFTSNAAIINAVETNGRLQLPIAQNNQTGPTALTRGGITGSDWALDLTRDFRLRIDWRFNAPTTMFGQVQIGVGFAQEFNESTGDISEGALFVFRRNSFGPVEGPIVRRGGADISAAISNRDNQRGTLYVEFDAATNRLRFTQQGFSDDTTTNIANFRTAGMTAARLALVAESSAASPAVAGPSSYFDNVFVDIGTIVPPPPPPAPAPFSAGAAPSGGPSAPTGASVGLDANPCPSDLDGDGDVDAADLALLLARQDPPATVAQIRALLSAMGPCRR